MVVIISRPPLVRWERSGSDVLIQAELNDSDPNADLEFTLIGVNSVSETDFML
jgi:hypothetical protein